MAKIGSLTADLTLKSASFIADLGKSAHAVAKNTKSGDLAARCSAIELSLTLRGVSARSASSIMAPG